MVHTPDETPPTDIAREIRVVRGQRVLLDADLAALFGVPTKVFNQAVRRNITRFPQDFLIQLTPMEAKSLKAETAPSESSKNQEVRPSRSQIVTLNRGRGGNLKYPPMAFTEHGAIMAATILNSARAIQMTVLVVRSFVKARELMSSHAQLAKELNALKRSVAELDADTRRQFEVVHEAILGLMRPPNSRQ